MTTELPPKAKAALSFLKGEIQDNAIEVNVPDDGKWKLEMLGRLDKLEAAIKWQGNIQMVEKELTEKELADKRIDKLEAIIKRVDFETGLETHAVDHADLLATQMTVRDRLDKVEADLLNHVTITHGWLQGSDDRGASKTMDRFAEGLDSQHKRIEALEELGANRDRGLGYARTDYERLYERIEGLETTVHALHTAQAEHHARVTKLATRFMDRLQESVLDIGAITERLDNVIDYVDQHVPDVEDKPGAHVKVVEKEKA